MVVATVTKDWIKELKNRSDGVRAAFDAIRDKYGYTQMGKLYSQIETIVLTDSSISALTDDDERWTSAIEKLDKNLALTRQGTDAWKQMIDETAREIALSYEAITSYPDDFTPKKTYIYTGKYYKEDQEHVLIKTGIYEHIGQDVTKKVNSEIIERIATLTLDIEKTLHRDKDIIALDNCLFNTTTMQTEEFSAKRFVLNKLPIAYDPELGYEKWQGLINEWVDDPIFADTLQEFIGYLWVDSQSVKKLLYIDGDYDSGKSVFCYAIQNMLGGKIESNYSSLSLHDMCSSNYGSNYRSSMLYGKLANIRSDVNVEIQPHSLDDLKSLTGGDTITVRMIYDKPFQLHSRAKIIWTGNGPPNLPESGMNDDAVLRRWLPITFPYKFIPPDELLNQDIDDIRIKTGISDDKLRKTVISETMKSEIFNWSLDGIKRLRDQYDLQRFSYDPSVEEIRKWFETRKLMTVVDKFMIDTMVSSSYEYIPKRDIYIRYNKWSNDKKLPIMSENSFHRKLKNNNFFYVDNYYTSCRGKRIHTWRGVKWIH